MHALIKVKKAMSFTAHLRVVKRLSKSKSSKLYMPFRIESLARKLVNNNWGDVRGSKEDIQRPGD